MQQVALIIPLEQLDNPVKQILGGQKIPGIFLVTPGHQGIACHRPEKASDKATLGPLARPVHLRHPQNRQFQLAVFFPGQCQRFQPGQQLSMLLCRVGCQFFRGILGSRGKHLSPGNQENPVHLAFFCQGQDSFQMGSRIRSLCRPEIHQKQIGFLDLKDLGGPLLHYVHLIRPCPFICSRVLTQKQHLPIFLLKQIGKVQGHRFPHSNAQYRSAPSCRHGPASFPLSPVQCPKGPLFFSLPAFSHQPFSLSSFRQSPGF